MRGWMGNFLLAVPNEFPFLLFLLVAHSFAIMAYTASIDTFLWFFTILRTFSVPRSINLVSSDYPKVESYRHVMHRLLHYRFEGCAL